MAITIEQANAVSKPYYDKSFTENVYRDCTLLMLLKDAKRMIPGGTDARFPINVSELGTATAIGPREQVPFASTDTMTSVLTTWAYYVVRNFIWKDEQVENVGDQAVVRLVRRKVEEMISDMATKMGRDIYTKNVSGKGFNPISDLIGATAFGGVDEPAFRSGTIVPSSGSIKIYGSTNDSLSRAINASRFGTKKVTDIVISPLIKTMVEQAWVAQAGRIDVAESKRKRDLGLDTFRFMNVDFVSDQFAGETTPNNTEGVLYGIDTEAITCYESAAGTKNGEWIEATLAGYPGAMARVSEWTGQLTVTRRRTMFKATQKVTGVTFS